MPRFAYALPHDPRHGVPWADVARRIPETDNTDHKKFMLGRGILRERMFVQSSGDLPDLTLVLWDCEDLEAATRPPAKTARSEHEDWLFYTVLGQFHGQHLPTFRFPKSELLSGTTTQVTAIADTQTLFALPVDTQRLDGVRRLMTRLESGDLMQVHREFLESAGVREEWVWLQPKRDDLPDLLLIHWIGDDLPGAAARITSQQSPVARMARAFFEELGIDLGQAAGRTVEPLFAMHVRRSDRFELGVKQTATRLVSAIRREQWPAVQALFSTHVMLQEPPAATRHVSAADAASLLKKSVHGHARELRTADMLLGEDALLLPVGTDGSGTAGRALLMQVDNHTICSLAVVADWPGPIRGNQPGN